MGRSEGVTHNHTSLPRRFRPRRLVGVREKGPTALLAPRDLPASVSPQVPAASRTIHPPLTSVVQDNTFGASVSRRFPTFSVSYPTVPTIPSKAEPPGVIQTPFLTGSIRCASASDWVQSQSPPGLTRPPSALSLPSRGSLLGHPARVLTALPPPPCFHGVARTFVHACVPVSPVETLRRLGRPPCPRALGRDA